jgi:hypothetical protein
MRQLRFVRKWVRSMRVPDASPSSTELLASVYQAPVHMGAAYWIPAFWVPSLLVTHYLVFRILIQRRNERAPLREEEIKVAHGGTPFALGDC